MERVSPLSKFITSQVVQAHSASLTMMVPVNKMTDLVEKDKLKLQNQHPHGQQMLTNPHQLEVWDKLQVVVWVWQQGLVQLLLDNK